MKIIICGPVFNENVERMLKDSSPAAGKFLMNLTKGLENNNIDVDKAVYISYPLLKSEKDVLNEFSKNDIVQIKSKYVLKSVLDFQKKLLTKIDKDTVVIFYNMSYAYLGLKNKIEKKKGKAIFLLADHTRSQEYKNIFRKLYARSCEYEISKFDKVITLAGNPNVKFKKNNKSICICGGIKNDDYIDFSLRENKNTLNIMYSGLLSTVTGVDILLETIKKYKKDNVKFYISGKGELEDKIKDLEQTNSNIEFLGFLSHKKYIKHLNNADILINPRNMNLDQNNNNFPSKILDYLATGKVIISTYFSGYDKFRNNIIFFDGSSKDLINCIEKCINEYSVLNKYYYEANRKLAKDYDWDNQAKKIIDFINMEYNDAKNLY